MGTWCGVVAMCMVMIVVVVMMMIVLLCVARSYTGNMLSVKPNTKCRNESLA